MNNQNNNANNNANNNQNDKQVHEYRLVINEKPYRRRSLIPILAMILFFGLIAYGLKTVVFLFIGNDKSFDIENIETRKFEDILKDRTVAFYLGDKIYTTRLSADAEIVEIGSNIGYSLIRDSLYYKYSFKRKDGSINFDKSEYSVDNNLKTVNYLNDEDEMVVSVYNLEQTDMDTEYMKKMCIDFINNTKVSDSSIPISEYLKHSIIYGYKVNLNYIKNVNYEKNVETGIKEFSFSNGEMNLKLTSLNKDISDYERKEFDDGIVLYINENMYYIFMGDNSFKIDLKLNDNEKEINIDLIHDYFIKTLKKEY